MEEQVPNNSIATFRLNLFKQSHPDLDISEIVPEFFELESSEFEIWEKHQYFQYYSELRKYESRFREEALKAKEEENKIQKRKVLDLLSTLYGTETIEILSKKLPANIFYDPAQNINKTSVLKALRNIFTDYDETKIQLEFETIYSTIFGTLNNQENNGEEVYTPEFPPSEADKILIVEKTNTEFFPDKFIYKRECYKKLYDEIISVLQDSPVAVIGDPGIGKSTFLRYIVSKKRTESNTNGTGTLNKIYWEMESGHWQFYNGQNIQSGSHDIDDWTSDDVLVLIDGKLKPKHLKKQKNIILFCSPQPQNYMKLIKTFSGATFIMPCWDLKEIIDFLCSKNVICVIMDKFYERMLKSLEREDNAAYLNVKARNQEIFSNDSAIPQINEIGSVHEYDEDVRIKVLTKPEFLIEQVIYRYKLCGGKLRLLVHNQINFKLLKKQVIKSVNSLSLEDIKHQECLDLQGNVPSIIYSMNPVDMNSDPRDFVVGFSSNYVSEIASAKMIHEYSKQLNFLFVAMQNQRIGSSLIGQIFEKLVIESIVTKKLSNLNGRILTGDKAGEGISLDFGKIVSKDYDATDGNLKLLIDVDGDVGPPNFFFTPVQSNAAAVDAIFYNSSKRKLYFLQITISKFHDFKMKYLQDLANSFGKSPKNIEFLFLVPENLSLSFDKQRALTTSGKNMTRVPPGFRQSVMTVPKDVYASINPDS